MQRRIALCGPQRLLTSKRCTSANIKLDVPLEKLKKPTTHRLDYTVPVLDTPFNERFVPPHEFSGSYNRIADYLKIAELVRSLPTAKERIDFVSPFEREWTGFEKKWRRVNHAPLHGTRKAWAIPPIPDYFNINSFYAGIMRASWPNPERMADAWSAYYDELNLPVKSFEKRVTESLLCALSEKPELDKEAVDILLRRLLDDAFCSLAHSHTRYGEMRISHAPRCESFWISAGFSHLYLDYNVETEETTRLSTRQGIRIYGDHRNQLGELAFTMRDEFVAQVRQREPMKGLKLKDIPEIGLMYSSFYKTYQNYLLLYPEHYGLTVDKDPLNQCPGYECDSGETHPYGRLAIKNIMGLHQKLKHWNVEEGEENEKVWMNCLTGTATASLFNWMNAQAHCQGYTQYTDDFVENFASQLIMSDGQEFFFATGQLNTLAFNIQCPGFTNDKLNNIVFNGPFYLYDEYDETSGKFIYYVDNDDGTRTKKDGLNPKVLGCILNMLAVK